MNEDSANGAVVFILLDRQGSILHHHSCANLQILCMGLSFSLVQGIPSVMRCSCSVHGTLLQAAPRMRGLTTDIVGISQELLGMKAHLQIHG